MRISRFCINKFGKFSNYQMHLPVLARDFFLIYGDNEAGKSTLLKAITQFLYGFDQFDLAPRVSGCLEKDNGESISFLRKKKSGRSLLRDLEDQRNLSPGELTSFIGTVEEKYYKILYGIDHQTLHNSKDNILQGDFERIFFEVGGGLNNVRLISASLDNHAKKLYTPTARSGPEINKILSQLKKIQKEFREAAKESRELLALKGQIQELEIKIAENKQGMMHLEEEKARLNRIAQVLPLMAQWDTLQQKLQDFVQVPNLPEKCTETRGKIAGALTNFQTQRQDLVQQIKEQEEKLVHLVVDPGYLAAEARILEAYSKVENYRQALGILPGLEQQSNQLAAELTSRARALGITADILNDQSWRLPILVKHELQQLVDQYRGLISEKDNGEKELAQKSRRYRLRQTECEQLGPAVPTGTVRTYLTRAEQGRGYEIELKKKTAQCQSLAAQIEQLLSTLPSWHGTVEQLAAARVPLTATVEEYGKRFDILTTRKREVELEIRKTKKTQREKELALQTLEQSYAVPTEQDLIAHRQQRDALWKQVRRTLEGLPLAQKAGNLQELPVKYESLVIRADKTSDLMRREAEQVAEKAHLLLEQAKLQEQFQELQAVKGKLDTKTQALQAAWEKLWATAAIVPLPPPEMKDWLGQREQILAKCQLLRDLELEKQHYCAQINTFQNDLIQAARTIGFTEVPAPGLSFGAFLDSLDQHCSVLEEQHQRRLQLDGELKTLQKDLQELHDQLNNVRENLKNCEASWHRACRQLPLKIPVELAKGQVLLEAYQQLETLFTQWKQAQEQMVSCQKTVASFSEATKQLSQELVASLLQEPPDQAVITLYRNLQQSLGNHRAGNEVKNQLKQNRQDLQKTLHKLEQLTQEKASLLQLTGCRDFTMLEAIEKSYQEKVVLVTKIKQLEKQLLAKSEGLSLEALFAKCLPYAGEVENQLNQVNLRLREFKALNDELLESIGKLKQRNDDLEQSTKAAAAAEQQQMLVAALREKCLTYLQLCLGERILRKGVEKFRQDNQQWVMKRSGEIFMKLTRNSFRSLEVRLDEQNKPVICGIRHDGTAVDTGEMSDGTLDQLYLSLRLASIEKQVTTKRRMPVILDDILVDFDDHRAAVALEVLYSLSEKMQILFFTHHRRLQEMLTGIIPQEEMASHVIELG